MGRLLVLIYFIATNLTHATFDETSAVSVFLLPRSITLCELNQHDRELAIEKMHQKKWEICNNTKKDICLKITINEAGFIVPKLAAISAGCQYASDSTNDAVCVAVEFYSLANDGSDVRTLDKCFLNLHPSKGKLIICIDNIEKRSFPHAIDTPNFVPKFIELSDQERSDHSENSPHTTNHQRDQCVIRYTSLDDKVREQSEPRHDEAFIKQYNDHLAYLFNVQFKNEDLNPEQAFKNLDEIYTKNSIERQILDTEFDSIKKINYTRIPPITHTIWFTSDNNPRELSDEYLYWLEKSIHSNPKEHGFRHLFWLIDRTKIPKTVEHLESIGVEVHEVKELDSFGLQEQFESEIRACRFGRASDIMRIVILNKIGGIYKDTDYRIHQSLLPLMMAYDFVACREPMSSFLGNAFIAAIPGHPILVKNIELLKRNFEPENIPKYIKMIPELDGFKTILLTGPGIFTTGVLKAIGQPGYKDIILPHERLFPTPIKGYPQKIPVKPNQPVPLSAFGVHYWETSWAGVRAKIFGSFG